MTTAAMKFIAAVLISGMSVIAGPVPVPNPLFHDTKPLYPDLSPAYPVSNSLFSERNAYPYRESSPYLPESLLSDMDGPLSEADLFPEDDLTSDRLALTNAERSQLLGLLTNDLGATEGDDYAPLAYGLPPQPVDPDWYEALGLASPYDSENAGQEYEDYLNMVDAWPQTNSVSQLPAGQNQGMSKKAAPGPAAAAAQPSAKKPAAADDDNEDDDSDDDSEDKDAAESLVQQIDDLRKSVRKVGLSHSASRAIPHQPRHTGVPTPSSTVIAATAAAAQPESGRPGSGEAPLVDQLRAAAAEPSTASQPALGDSETTYETIKRFLVMEDALKRLPKKMTKKTKRFVSDQFTQQLEDLRTVKT